MAQVGSGTVPKTAKLYLYLNALLYIIFGAWCALDPTWTAQAVGFSLPGNQGLAEFVAVYGGLEFGVGVFFLLCARSFSFQLKYAGVLFGACFYTGICIFRTFAIAQVGFDIGAGINFYISECVLTLWSLILLSKFPSSPKA